MGKTTTETTELMYRIARYLGLQSGSLQSAVTVEGQPIPTDLAHFAATAEEGVFEDCIASLYEDGRYRRRQRLLARRWRILDWLFGDLHVRLYRHMWLNGNDEAAQRRRDYRSYLRKGFLYKDRSGLHTIRHSSYNEKQLQLLLDGRQWELLQLLKYGKDHLPEPDNFEQVVYDEAPPLAPGIPAPPPQVAEYLLRAIRGTEFEITR